MKDFNEKKLQSVASSAHVKRKQTSFLFFLIYFFTIVTEKKVDDAGCGSGLSHLMNADGCRSAAVERPRLNKPADSQAQTGRPGRTALIFLPISCGYEQMQQTHISVF